MLKINKGISTPIALTIIIVLAVILAGGTLGYQYYYLPKQEVEEEISEEEEISKNEISKDETSDWKTYTNEEYGFEIKYPEDFIVDEKYIYNISSGLSASGSSVLPGVSFSVPVTYTTGTNLISDTKLSIE